MNKDEEYVRSVWERVDNSSSPVPLYFVYGIQWACSDDNEEGAWSAAAEYTRNHLEQVRQLREEIAEMGGEFAKRNCLEHVECIRRRARQARILARLESALATLTQGMNPEALP